MSKHTPGPWAQQGRYIVAPNGFTVADLQPMGGHNARLVAAAPDLLEALEFVIRGVPDTWEGVQKARAAIAKATGGEG